MFSLLTASPGIFFFSFFYDGIKLSYPQLGESNFPGVRLFKLFFFLFCNSTQANSFLPHPLPPLTGASGRKMTVFFYSKEMNLIL